MRHKKRPYGPGGPWLEAYLIKHNISVRQAAKAINIGINDLIRIIISRARPDTETRGKISALTNGDVPPHAWGSPTSKELLPAYLCPPKTRGECVEGVRPCPFLTCRYHLWNDIKPKHIPDGLPDESCALDIADEGEHTLLEISALLILTRERVRQVEHIATKKLSRRFELLKED